jgi:isopropylmalate/homocitrate/citramalate synthase
LREGEQTADVAFSLHDKERIATVLDEAGVDRIQIAIGNSSREEVSSLIARLRRAKAEVLIIGFSADWKKQIDVAIECGFHCLNIAYRTSPHLLKIMNVSEEEALATSVGAVEYAKKRGAETVIFSPTDSTRSNWKFLRKIYVRTVEAGADEVYVLDTLGVASPVAMHRLVLKVKDAVNKPIGVHTHNDYGLGLANSFAALEAGAETVDTCVNGLGDRVGNPALAEVVTGLTLLFGCSVNVAIEKLYLISKIVSECSGVKIPVNMPIVGRNVFSQKLDIHVRACLKDPLAFQPFAPSLFGQVQHIVIGKGTGVYALRARLRELEMGADLSDDQLSAALVEIWRLAEKNKHCLSDTELKDILRKTI